MNGSDSNQSNESQTITESVQTELRVKRSDRPTFLMEVEEPEDRIWQLESAIDLHRDGHLTNAELYAILDDED